MCIVHGIELKKKLKREMKRKNSEEDKQKKKNIYIYIYIYKLKQAYDIFLNYLLHIQNIYPIILFGIHLLKKATIQR